MRKPYALPEQYADWDTEELAHYASRLAYMIMVMCEKRGVENSLDRHALGNAYDELCVMKTLLDARVDAYTTKLLIERLCNILGDDLASYDKRGREGRLMRKQLEARKRLG